MLPLIASLAFTGQVPKTASNILQIKRGKGQLVYVGFRHSRDPKDKQFKQLRALWQEEKPTLILNEDITPQPHATLEESIKYDGERGALAFWAKKDKIAIRSIDRTWREEVRTVPISTPGSTVKMFYFIRGLQQDMQRPGAQATDAMAQRELDFLAKQGIGWAPHSIADVDPIWKGLGIPGDWRKPKIAWIVPSGNGPLNQVSKALNAKRDEHMIDVIKQELKNGNKIFAVVGASHVASQKAVLLEK